MSATTVLVPVSEQESVNLLRGGPAAEATVGAIAQRAGSLRSRVAAVDAIREQLHEELYTERIELPRFLRRFLPGRGREPQGLSQSPYDPLHQIFGRSLPVAGPPRAAAERIQTLLVMDDDAFRAAVTSDLAMLVGRRVQGIRLDLAGERIFPEREIRAEVAAIAEAMQAHDVMSAWNLVVTVAAWSRPVWRLDGELIRELLETVGLTIKPEPATAIFQGLMAEPLLERLPASLPSFTGGGGYYSASATGLLAGSLRMSASRLAANVRRNASDEARTLRHLRILAEAAFFCEGQGFGLAEACGVEWHDRH